MFGIFVFRPYRAEPVPNPIQGRCPWLYGSCPVGAKSQLPAPNGAGHLSKGQLPGPDGASHLPKGQLPGPNGAGHRSKASSPGQMELAICRKASSPSQMELAICRKASSPSRMEPAIYRKASSPGRMELAIGQGPASQANGPRPFARWRLRFLSFLSFPSAAWEHGRKKLRFPDRKQSFRGSGSQAELGNRKKTPGTPCQ
uniref:Uncharacterized protein n=1 Tax=Candidatus Kentrum sp. DK TaxID=2126562 RepID=A0A450TDN8_9GAMM|nr:MAG: hypothetical protein BECKDK2373C_GA0170839_112512 [Candidatus Kentron sp. DK]